MMSRMDKQGLPDALARGWVAGWIQVARGGLLRWGTAVVLAGTATGVQAYDAERAQTLAKQNACFGCHAIERKLVGPSFAQIAQRYKADATAPARLVKKVVQGGAGVWGPIPMPSQPRLSEAEAKVLVDWVLAGAPRK
ncbi:Cytochrome c551 [Mycetohabitans rhizoxinica HKI 454]|uniref:Cytochrome c551 n=1 Tax=Mycetohabitans rhizoxinica (strain DSM 19002 / CIP 109453 / HKI 454) TaxID=882378 RepID=E5AMP1_MYCRK|nr:Cytochrome c551 [Mycetohabitans rhizoxinica HKI 454]